MKTTQQQPVNSNQEAKKDTPKKSSAIAAAAKGESAVDKTRASAGRDTNGQGNLANTGTNTSYEEE
jgi:hypothetical protein